MYRQHRILLPALMVMVLVGCMPTTDSRIRGRILLWHSGGESEAIVFDELIQRFEEIYPDARVLRTLIPEGELREQYVTSARSGLGPDVFIGDSAWIRELAADRLIKPIDGLNVEISNYLSTAVVNVTLDGSLYGVPYSLAPVALYYNPDLVDEPAGTLGELITQAETVGLALNTSFVGSFWGTQAFGGRLFDEQGRVLLNQGGYASWLSWLRDARGSSGVSASSDRDTLVRLFTNGQVGYYVGTPDDLTRIRDAEIPVAVAQLPSGQGGTSGPLLEVDAFLFSPNSPGVATRTAAAFAQFVTSNSQGATLARRAGVVPANARVRIDSRAFPVITGFIAQSRTAVAMPNTEQMALLLENGEQTVSRVLDDISDPAQAANELTQLVNDAIGLESVEIVQRDRCTLRGDLIVWHSWGGADERALQMIVDEYRERCPRVTIELLRISPVSSLVNGYINLYETGVAPDVMLIPSREVHPLAIEQQIATFPNSESLQQFIPTTVEVMRHQGAVYGLPLTLDATVLYANSDRMTDPPTLIDNLLTEAANGSGVIIPIGFDDAFWGISAFGARVFDDSYRVILHTTGFDQWLAWLAEAQITPNVTLVNTTAAGADAFINSDNAAYLIASQEVLATVRDAIGIESLTIAQLPDGPAGDALSLVDAEGFVVNATLEDTQRELALDFITFATNADSQMIILENTDYIPTNVNLDMEDYPLKMGFRTEAARAFVLPGVMQREQLLAHGDRVYREVLEEGVDPAMAAVDFAVSVNQANGFEIIPTATPTPVDAAASTEIAPDNSMPLATEEAPVDGQ